MFSGPDSWQTVLHLELAIGCWFPCPDPDPLNYSRAFSLESAFDQLPDCGPARLDKRSWGSVARAERLPGGRSLGVRTDCRWWLRKKQSVPLTLQSHCPILMVQGLQRVEAVGTGGRCKVWSQVSAAGSSESPSPSSGACPHEHWRLLGPPTPSGVPEQARGCLSPQAPYNSNMNTSLRFAF
jgi:hypothetical protein